MTADRSDSILWTSEDGSPIARQLWPARTDTVRSNEQMSCVVRSCRDGGQNSMMLNRVLCMLHNPHEIGTMWWKHGGSIQWLSIGSDNEQHTLNQDTMINNSKKQEGSSTLTALAWGPAHITLRLQNNHMHIPTCPSHVSFFFDIHHKGCNKDRQKRTSMFSSLPHEEQEIQKMSHLPLF